MKIKWGEHTWEEIVEKAKTGAVVVSPWGSTEQHGPCLPLDTDIHNAERIANDGARVANERYGIPVLVLPTMPFGLAPHHMRFAGTITLEPETYIAVVAEVLRSVVKHGFRKIAVISGHGGNESGLQLGVRKVVMEFLDTSPLRVAIFQGHRDPHFAKLRTELMKDEPPEGQLGIHASRWETSKTLADRPHLVRKDKLVRPVLKEKSVPEWTWMIDELSETGAFGDPTLARADLGERMWNAWAEAAALFIKRLWETPLPEPQARGKHP